MRSAATCLECGHDPTRPTLPPIEPVYDVAVAAELIPYRPKAHLMSWLHRHKDLFPAIYRTMYIGSRARSSRVRVLTHTQILNIRWMILSGPGKAICSQPPTLPMPQTSSERVDSALTHDGKAG